MPFNFLLPIAIGSDHAGFEMKTQLIQYIQEKNILLTDYGTYDLSSADYPDYAHAVAYAVANNIAAFGILLCGSANGVCITANHHSGIRASLCWQNEIAVLARQHNNANIICLPARFIDLELAKQMIDTFIQTEFEGGRHLKRIQKIEC